MDNPILETRNLTKIYGQNVIFKDINLKVNEGETIVIIGPSGTGKSTLLRCINLLTPHDGGQVFLDGKEITAKGYNEDEVRQHIGMVFQNFLLFNHLTALNNVMIGLTRVRKMPRKRPAKKPWRNCTASGWPTAPTITRVSFPADSSSASPSPGRWRWTRASCCSTSPPPPSTRS